MKKILVISLGGSLIIPRTVDFVFLDKFKKTIRRHYNNYKFIVVCGGGSIARKYMEALSQEHKSQKERSLAGIRATRMNALFLMQFFGKEANHSLPVSMEEVKNNLAKNKVVICGALRYSTHSTSDSTAAKLAHFLNVEFINMTNVKGLYNSDPKKNKDAKFISKISWKEFEKKVHAFKFSPGQHFILDQQAATIIRKNKIKTYIVGKELKNLSNLLAGKEFVGTIIVG